MDLNPGRWRSGRIVPIGSSDLLRQLPARTGGMLSPAGRRRPDPAALPASGGMEMPKKECEVLGRRDGTGVCPRMVMHWHAGDG